MAGLAIFVDYENLAFVLQKRECCRLEHHLIGEGLLTHAKEHGKVYQAVMWAEWERFSSGKRQEQNAQAKLTEQGFDCLYSLRPSDRSYTEQAIIKKLPENGRNLDRVILVSGDYLFPELLSLIETEITLITVRLDGHDEERLDSEVEHIYFQDLLESDDVLTPLQTPHNMEPAAFYIWMQRVLQEELRRRNWKGMSFHMLARLLVERSLCEEDAEAQFYINQAVREGFLERSETELPTGHRVLLKPTVVERAVEPLWSFDEEFRWAQLIWALELILRRNPWWGYVTFSRLREELEKWSLFSGTDELQQMVEQAVESGIYHLEIEEGGSPLFRKKYKYTLGESLDLHQRIQDLPTLVLRVMRHLLEENAHWHGVSFSKLLDELNEQLQNSFEDIWIDRQRLKEWCNFLVAVGFLHAFRGRPRLVDGEFRDPPTLLRIVPEHPWVEHLNSHEVASEKVETEEVPNPLDAMRELDYYRLVVVIEHYLHISNNDAVVAGWMPMSTLFHVMGRSLERAFCNAVVRSAREKNIIEIRTHDPRPGQHPARGAHLDLDHPLSVEARRRLLRLLEMIQELQDRSGIVELYSLEARLREDSLFGESEEERLGWIELMREENLILVRPLSIPESGSEGSIRYQCSLNFRDRYVLALMESLYPALGSSGVPTEDSKQEEAFSASSSEFEAEPVIEPHNNTDS